MFRCFVGREVANVLRCGVRARVSHNLVHCKILADVEETVDYSTNNARDCVLCEFLSFYPYIVIMYTFYTPLVIIFPFWLRTVRIVIEL